MFDLDKMEKIWGIWFVGFGNHDMMAMVYQREGKVIGTFRTRSYDPRFRDPWAGVDKGSWWDVESKDGSHEAMIASARRFVAGIISGWPQKALMNDEIYVPDGTPEIAIQMMSSRPWCHMKKGEEAKQWMKDYEDGNLPAQKATKEDK